MPTWYILFYYLFCHPTMWSSTWMTRLIVISLAIRQRAAWAFVTLINQNIPKKRRNLRTYYYQACHPTMCAAWASTLINQNIPGRRNLSVYTKETYIHQVSLSIPSSYVYIFYVVPTYDTLMYVLFLLPPTFIYMLYINTVSFTASQPRVLR